MKRGVWIVVAALAAFVGLVVYTTMGVGRYQCEVCITFGGRTACRTASARTEELALRTATENACAQLASGMTESNRCQSTPPDRVRWLARGEDPR
jgi:hypothetical protein